MPDRGRRPQNRPAQRLILSLFISLSAFLAFAASASALTLGVSWSGVGGYTTTEMPLVGKSGASTFRVPLGGDFTAVPADNATVEAAAKSGITIHAEIAHSSTELPTGEGLTAFLEWAEYAVKRYGYGGQFWAEHPLLPYRPISSWEIGNEPNNNGIAAGPYGTYVGKVANAIQAASESQAGRRTEVLSAGLLVWGNTGTGPTGYQGALEYLSNAYANFKSNSNVTGVAIHPYELDPNTFYQPKGQPRFNRIEAFKYAVVGFHAELVELAKGGSQKSLWITETGWPAGGSEYQVEPSEQASLLKQAFDYAKSNAATLNLQDILWYDFRDFPTQNHWDNFCGLRTNSGSFRPAWTAFQEETGAPLSIPQAPAVSTQAATEVLSDRATFHGEVDPRGLATTYRFEYGPTTAYGSSAPFPDGNAGEGEGASPQTALVQALDSGTTYHYRIVASNQIGTSYGADAEFTTPSSGSWALASGGTTVNPGQWVYYTGAGNQIWQWYWNGAAWFNTQATTHAAAPGAVPSAIASGGSPNNPAEWVYYHGSDNQIWQWYWNGSSSSNGVLSGGQPAAANSSPTALASGGSPNNPAEWVYYTGSNNQIWQWYWNGSYWTDTQATTHAVAANSSPTALSSGGTPNNPGQWVYYHGSDNQIWQWYWNGSSSSNGVLSGGEPIAAGASPVAITSGGTPNNPDQWVYYKGADGQIWQWYWNGSTWTNGAL